MSLFDLITKPIFSEPKSRSCPRCGSRLDDFQINLDNFFIKCPDCSDEFDPKMVFYDSDIIFLAESVPPDKRDQFLITHGFVKETVNRTPKWMVIGLIVILALCGIVLGVKSLCNVWWKALVYLLTAAILCFLVFFYYQREKKPKWKRESGKGSKGRDMRGKANNS